MPTYRRGVAAVEEAAVRKSGKMRAFEPTIKWNEDGEKRYVLVLTPADEVATFELHEWIPVGKGEKANGETYTRWGSFISRKDPYIGEDYDEIQDRLGVDPKTRCVGVAVELEPVFETVKGRQRPKGFAVKTSNYTRRVEDGEGTEEVTQPELGLIVQSSFLMWSPLVSLDQSQGPFTDLPIEVTRRGTGTGTRYDFVPFMDAPVDLSPIVDFLDGISYLREDMPELLEELDGLESEVDKAQKVAMSLLDRWIHEVADKKRYDELVGPIKEIPQKFGKKKAAANSDRPARPARSTAREAAQSEPEAPAPVAQGETPEERFARLRAKVEKRSAE